MSTKGFKMVEENVDDIEEEEELDQNVADDQDDDDELEDDDIEEDDVDDEDDDDSDESADGADEGDEDSDESDDEDDDSKKDDLDSKSKDDKMAHAFKEKQRKLSIANQKAAKAENDLAIANRRIIELTQGVRPEIPPLPNALDANYETLMAERDKAVIAQNSFDINLKNQKTIQDTAHTEFITQRVEKLEASKKSFRALSSKMGLATKDLDAYEDHVSSVLTSANAQTAEFILDHSKGPLIVKYLSDHPLILEKVADMSPVAASAYITEAVAPKVKSFIKTKKVPAPTKRIGQGKKSTKKVDPMIKGATFA